MLVSSIPIKFDIPFAQAAGSGFITEPIPITTTAPGRASLTSGFPPTTFEPEASGGNPPWGADMNGILYQVTAWLQWAQGGGFPVAYDSAFSTAIAGYMNGALLKSATAGHYWQSTADNNATNPDAGGGGWVMFPDTLIQQQAGNFTATDSGAVNASIITLSPQPASWASLVGSPLRFLIANTNTTTSVTLAITGLSGTKTLKNTDGTAMVIGQLTVGGLVEGFYDGTNVQIAAPGKPSPGGSSVLPPGAIVLCPNEVAFSGTLECNGASYLRSTYPNLFNSIGTRYGAVDANHFNVPDMRGIFVRGWDHGRGLDSAASSRAAPGVLAPVAAGATGPSGDHVGTTEAWAVGPITGANIQLQWPIMYAGSGLTKGAFLYNAAEGFAMTGDPWGGFPPSTNPSHVPPYMFGNAQGGYPAWTYSAYDQSFLAPGTGFSGSPYDNAIENAAAIQTLGCISGSVTTSAQETRPVNINMMYVIAY